MKGSPRRSSFFQAHRCNAYCRGDTHADTLFLTPSAQENAAGVLATFCTQHTRTFVHTEPAPECDRAVTVEDYSTGSSGAFGVVRLDDGSQPYLLVWRSAEQIAQ